MFLKKEKPPYGGNHYSKKWLGTDHPPRAVFPPHHFTISLEFSITRSFREPIFLHQKYVLEGLTPAQIAAQTFSSKKTVVKWLQGLSIPLKPEDIPATSQTPYGFKRVHGRLVSDAKEEQNVQRLLELKKKGLTYREIAETMNSLKIHPRKSGGKWHLKTIYKILSRYRADSPKPRCPDTLVANKEILPKASVNVAAISIATPSMLDDGRPE